MLCEYPGCTREGHAVCDSCPMVFCSDHGTVGGDREVADVGMIAFPSMCHQHGGFNADA